MTGQDRSQLLSQIEGELRRLLPAHTQHRLWFQEPGDDQDTPAAYHLEVVDGATCYATRRVPLPDAWLDAHVEASLLADLYLTHPEADA